MKDNRETQLGTIYAGFSYFLWGLLPIYWKFLDRVSAQEILANRIFWSFIFMLMVLLFANKYSLFFSTIKTLIQNKRQFMALIVASILISGNWYIYIWAVNNDHIIDASLGYYINPLVSVLLGMFVLKEKLSFYQYISFGLAAIGVIIITVAYGRFPWVALGLAISFGLYGLAKKLIHVDSSVGLTLETLVITPVAAIYLGYLFLNGTNAFLAADSMTSILLIGAGAATAVPLLYFAMGAQRIPLSLLGFIQYISPTISLLLGIFVYHEHFSKVQLISFVFIWSALSIYTFSTTRNLTERKLKEKAS
ncbi:EamA family transporter RarD [Bacillus rubiinfantis]|uniref:EamA family transporter RarD n=1 Tax=Bacillus rubiinfantis TaxID=1499680 RepID=UPI0005AA9B4A|nr:EamA family transporter RarD [Bacillus rubiinfantis]